jgi:predicted DNA-binding protein (MmcQ/YjbR family)
MAEFENQEAVQAAICEVASRFPESYEESPWGERVAKVRGKVFSFTGIQEGRLWLTIKLPSTGPALLQRPYVQPAGYGLGRAGWVTMSFHDPKDFPIDELEGWMTESYRSIAPKTLLKTWEQANNGPARPRPAAPAKPRAPRKKVELQKIVLVGKDNLRLDRARKSLTSAGVDVTESGEPGQDMLSRILEKQPGIAVLDLGSHTVQVLEFAHYLHNDTMGKTRIAFAGIRDTAAEKHIASTWPQAVLASRLPPGDDAFVAALSQIAKT